MTEFIPLPTGASRMKRAAIGLMALGALLLIASAVMPGNWRPALVAWRPLALLLFGAGSFLMWLYTRRKAEKVRLSALASLTHSSLTPYEFAPITLPMEDVPPEPAQTQALLDASYGSARAPSPAPLEPIRPEPVEAVLPPPEPAPAASTAPTAPPAPMAPAYAVDEVASSPTLSATASADSVPELAPAPIASPNHWSAGLLRALEWRRFEALCEEMFKQDGYVTRTSARGADSGADIWLHSRLDLQQAVRVVQCRNWSPEPIGVAAVREFLGAMVDADLQSGAIMTCGSFTAEAEALSRRRSITLVNGADLLALIAKRADALQRELLVVATEGDYARPTCRICGQKLAPNATLPNGVTRWICEATPGCDGQLDWNAGPA